LNRSGELASVPFIRTDGWYWLIAGVAALGLFALAVRGAAV
jgi:hypothetical protein